MKLFLIWQDTNNNYDTYDSAVVAAETAEQAKFIFPSEYYVWDEYAWAFKYGDGTTRKERRVPSEWVMPCDVSVRHIGEAVPGTQAGLIKASYNAG